jgi:hypothetical protein
MGTALAARIPLVCSHRPPGAPLGERVAYLTAQASLPDQDTLTAYCLAVVDQALRAHGSFPHAQAQGVQR